MTLVRLQNVWYWVSISFFELWVKLRETGFAVVPQWSEIFFSWSEFASSPTTTQVRGSPIVYSSPHRPVCGSDKSQAQAITAACNVDSHWFENSDFRCWRRKNMEFAEHWAHEWNPRCSSFSSTQIFRSNFHVETQWGLEAKVNTSARDEILPSPLVQVVTGAKIWSFPFGWNFPVNRKVCTRPGKAAMGRLELLQKRSQATNFDWEQDFTFPDDDA